ARGYGNLGMILREQAKYAEAEPLFRAALKVYQAARGEADPDTAHGYGNLGMILGDQWKLAEAEPLLRAALKVCQAARGEAHPDTAIAYGNLARNLSRQGEYADAEPLYLVALGILRAALGEAHPHTARAYYDLTSTLASQGKWAAAERSAAAAVESYESARVAVAGGLDRASFGITASPYRLLAAARARLGRPAEAWAALEADLARGLLDQTADPAAAPTPAERARAAAVRDSLGRLCSRVTALVTAREPTAADRRELDALRAERDKLEGELASLAAAPGRRGVADFAAVRAALPADAALVAWVDPSPQRNGEGPSWGCVVRPAGDPAWELLPGSGPAGAWTDADATLPRRFREALAGGAPRAEVDALARQLHAQRLAPLGKHLAGVKRLIVVPAGRMAGVPVEALTDAFTVSYTPSGTVLARLKAAPRPAGSAALAVGDPVFATDGIPAPRPGGGLPPGGLLVTQVVPGGPAADARIRPGDVLLRYAGADLTDAAKLKELIAARAKDASVPVVVWRAGEKDAATRDLRPGPLGVVLDPDPAPAAVAARRRTDLALAALARGGDWRELPGTRVELDRLARLFGADLTALTRSDASEQRLEELRAGGGLKRFRYVHLATHGEANDARAFDSALILARDRLPGPTDVPKAGGRSFDGRLTAAEVLADWKLDAELVTLSACETGLGRGGGGDGLLGFAQAFLAAGSRSVCLSLWKVDDAATALLMDRFYSNLLGKRDGLAKPLGKAAALAEAKGWLRDLSFDDALRLSAELGRGVPRAKGEKALELAVPDAAPVKGVNQPRPFAHPRYWAGFVLIGDPD
ncbi:MAG: hypothetical protein C0501_31805, partial [Isosphaera sp.]|nr:hypothetical protein [Isosphaera sp.]